MHILVWVYIKLTYYLYAGFGILACAEEVIKLDPAQSASEPLPRPWESLAQIQKQIYAIVIVYVVVAGDFGRTYVAEEAEVGMDALQPALGIPDVPADQITEHLRL